MSSVQDVVSVLERAGFERLPKPLTVVGTEFDFEAAARGTKTSHDLVLVATDDVPGRRLQRLVAGLARSLDLAESRRPVSLVLLGNIAATNRSELERYARVLPIVTPTPSTQEITDALAVLLPLNLTPTELLHGSDPINEVMAVLGPLKATSDRIALVRAASGGADAVREVLRRYANEGAGWQEEGWNGDD
ncbi:hypothetical protein [uncultured Microbacterium sp.]|uniref:hypothetical protein n=1 Tax=uncultured Microbacterium sp. TaxID=191216 RepID=UPI0028DB968F|nr:hypothetical protein [uncultured Microbacterium sp.]